MWQDSHSGGSPGLLQPCSASASDWGSGSFSVDAAATWEACFGAERPSDTAGFIISEHMPGGNLLQLPNQGPVVEHGQTLQTMVPGDDSLMQLFDVFSTTGSFGSTQLGQSPAVPQQQQHYEQGSCRPSHQLLTTEPLCRPLFSHSSNGSGSMSSAAYHVHDGSHLAWPGTHWLPDRVQQPLHYPIGMPPSLPLMVPEPHMAHPHAELRVCRPAVPISGNIVYSTSNGQYYSFDGAHSYEAAGTEAGTGVLLAPLQQQQHHHCHQQQHDQHYQRQQHDQHNQQQQQQDQQQDQHQQQHQQWVGMDSAAIAPDILPSTVLLTSCLPSTAGQQQVVRHPSAASDASNSSLVLQMPPGSMQAAATAEAAADFGHCNPAVGSGGEVFAELGNSWWQAPHAPAAAATASNAADSIGTAGNQWDGHAAPSGMTMHGDTTNGAPAAWAPVTAADSADMAGSSGNAKVGSNATAACQGQVGDADNVGGQQPLAASGSASRSRRRAKAAAAKAPASDGAAGASGAAAGPAASRGAVPGPSGRSSRFRGVTKHRRSGRFESHIWVKEMNRQVYLGGYEDEELAAEAFDVAVLKVKGKAARTNFPCQRYSDLLLVMDTITLDELIMVVRRQSQGFSRGSSSFRGVTRHPSGRWEARIGVPGSKHIYLGLFDQEKDAARSYDRALVRLKGTGAATNSKLSDYRVELAEHHTMQQALQGGGDSRSQALVAAPCAHFERWVKVGSETLGLPVAAEAWEQAVAETDAAVAAVTAVAKVAAE